MKTVNILLNHSFLAPHSDYFPLFRYSHIFANYGIRLNFFNTFSERLSNADVVILSSRYFKEWQNIQTRNIYNQTELFKKLENISSKVSNLIWFDQSDGTGSTDFGVLPYVTGFWKKQLLVNLDQYLIKSTDIVRKWLPKEIQEDYRQSLSFPYSSCEKDQLHKLKSAWNIGMHDYRFNNKYLSALSLISPNYPKLKLTAIAKERPVFLVNRGSTFSKNLIHSYQRKKITDHLIKYSNNNPKINVLSHGFVSKRTYYNELKNSQAMISPFGWGEICYKDFEAIISGCLLIKPTVSHIKTFPNIYDENITYYPINWDFTNINDVLNNLYNNKELMFEIANNAQKLFKHFYFEKELFLEHFNSLLN